MLRLLIGRWYKLLIKVRYGLNFYHKFPLVLLLVSLSYDI